MISDSTTSFTSVGGLIFSVLRGQAQRKVQETHKDGGQGPIASMLGPCGAMGPDLDGVCDIALPFCVFASSPYAYRTPFSAAHFILSDHCLTSPRPSDACVAIQGSNKPVLVGLKWSDGTHDHLV